MSREKRAIKAADEALRAALFSIKDGDMDLACNACRTAERNLVVAMEAAVKRVARITPKKVPQ